MLEEIFNRDENVLTEPYPHIILDNFFDERTSVGICEHFKKIKEQGLAETFEQERLARFPSYDAYCYIFRRDCGSPMNLFHSREWVSYIAQMFELPLLTDVVAEYHHHKVGSKSGASHTDYMNVYFKPNPLENGVNPWRFECNYMGGDEQSGVIQRTRAIAYLYYFGDENWQEGDGGETAIYDGQGKLVKKVAPIHNRMFIFACSPHSHHAFLSNHKSERNTVIGWLHMHPVAAIKRYGMTAGSWRPADLTGEKGDSLNVS